VSVQSLRENVPNEHIELSRLGINAYDDSGTSVGRWYALYVRSHHERVVEAALKGKGYLAFAPFYRTKRKRVDRTVEIEVPLFPGYVFCRFDVSRRLSVVVTPGIVEVVPGNRPEAIDDAEISSVQTLALSGLPVQPWPFLTSGQRIRLNAGPLVGAEGIFLRIKDSYHLLVSVNLLQRAVSVVVEKEAVEPIFGEHHVSALRM
jgi:transcription antitermination factor NusG